MYAKYTFVHLRVAHIIRVIIRIDGRRINRTWHRKHTINYMRPYGHHLDMTLRQGTAPNTHQAKVGGGKLGEDTCSSFWCFFARIYADATIRSHNDVCSPTQMTVLCGRSERDPKPKTNYMHTHQRTWNFLIIFIVLPQTYHESVPHTTATICVCMCMRG